MGLFCAIGAFVDARSHAGVGRGSSRRAAARAWLRRAPSWRSRRLPSRTRHGRRRGVLAAARCSRSPATARSWRVIVLTAIEFGVEAVMAGWSAAYALAVMPASPPGWSWRCTGPGWCGRTTAGPARSGSPHRSPRPSQSAGLLAMSGIAIVGLRRFGRSPAGRSGGRGHRARAARADADLSGRRSLPEAAPVLRSAR